MFQAKTVTHTNPLLNYIHLKSPTVSCKVLPNLGASIQELIINNIPIIEGVELNEAGIHSYYSAYQSALLFPFAGRVAKGQYTFLDKAYQLETNETKRNNAIHGLVFDKSFKIESCDLKQNEVLMHLSFISGGSMKGFPFKFKFDVTYQLSNHELITRFEVANIDDKPFPFSCGWHPYFKSDNLNTNTLSFKANEQLDCYSNMIPKTKVSSQLPPTFLLNDMNLDTTFFLSKNEVTYSAQKYILKIFLDSNILHIFTPNHRKSIALEPLSSAPNALNSKENLMVIYPQEKFQWTAGQIKLKFK